MFGLPAEAQQQSETLVDSDQNLEIFLILVEVSLTHFQGCRRVLKDIQLRNIGCNQIMIIIIIIMRQITFI